jgi:hypothetical protein
VSATLDVIEEMYMKNHSLVGTYELVSWENRHESGAITYPLGPDAKGAISYSPDGFVFVHIMAGNRNMHSVGDVFGGEITELRDSATTHISYCGSYEVKDNEVIHYVSVSSFPNWVSSEQRRNWEFQNGHLLLSAQGLQVGDERVGAYLIWRRTKSPASEERI